MFVSRRSPALALVAALSLTLAGCGDDSPSTPSTMLWNQESLPSGLEGSGLASVAFSGAQGLACGVQQVSGGMLAPLLLGTDGSGWSSVLPSGVATDVGFLDAAFDASGKGVVVGFNGNTQDPQGVCILDERSGTWTEIQATTSGLPGSVAYGDGRFWCAGVDDGGLLLYSDEPNVWLVDSSVFSTPQEKGVRDLVYNAGMFAAVGFDDHAESDDNFVLTNSGSGWSAMTGVPAANEAGVDFVSVAITDDGSILVGGERETGSESQPAGAFLALYDPTAFAWTEFVLPDPGGMRRVNRIHATSNGDWYLVCGRSTAQVWRFDNVGWSREGSWPSSVAQGIAESGDGSLYIAGTRAGGPIPTPLLVRRNPSTEEN